ncbi:hypothetical protein EVA_06408 [gut metagenome]|uniref:Uncharacterized protein n=1 Tax=gut metagenome TaxID=749906 RepID=J9GF05_9ZZZZ
MANRVCCYANPIFSIQKNSFSQRLLHISIRYIFKKIW